MKLLTTNSIFGVVRLGSPRTGGQCFLVIHFFMLKMLMKNLLIQETFKILKPESTLSCSWTLVLGNEDIKLYSWT